jgi:hypothetical protein
MDYSLLDCQAEFCNKKGRGDLALEIAKRSVVSAPSEFGTWARLAEIYVSLEQWDLALLTLNSCPMFTYQDKDAPRMPEPQKVFLPIMPEALCDEIEDSNLDDMELVHPTLRKLHAAGFKGTFLKAYILLTEITKKIGWDQLLKIRSQVSLPLTQLCCSSQWKQPRRGRRALLNRRSTHQRRVFKPSSSDSRRLDREAHPYRRRRSRQSRL